MTDTEKLPITTTLDAIRKFSPCERGWEKLLKHLGKTKADNEPVLFSTILKSNGPNDTLWCLRTIRPEHKDALKAFVKECVLRACDHAKKALPVFEAKFPNDHRPRKAIEAARKALRGDAADAARATRAADYAADAAAKATEREMQAQLIVKYFG